MVEQIERDTPPRRLDRDHASSLRSSITLFKGGRRTNCAHRVITGRRRITPYRGLCTQRPSPCGSVALIDWRPPL